MLERSLPFSPEADDSFFQELPPAAAVFVLQGESQADGILRAGEPYVSKTANLRRRLERLLGRQTEPSRRLNLRERVREIQFTVTGSDFESQFLLYRILRENFPNTYAARLRLRPAPMVKLHLENEYPRASITTQLAKTLWRQPTSSVGSSEVRQQLREEQSAFQAADGRGRPSPHGLYNLYYGPFPSRAAAEQFASDALDFFKMRRCVDDLHPDPAFPGCVYSEMKMCLAPCFKGCADAEYHSEVARVQTFFDTAGASLSRELAEQRERASAELAFEEAAAIHAKLEKLKPLVSQLPEIVQRIDRLRALVVQPSADAGCVSLFMFQNCMLEGAVPFSIEPRAESRSMESRVEETIARFADSHARSNVERMEHLAMLKRWYYRSHRTGEIFFADENGSWPLRRIVRGIGRVYKDEKAEQPATFSATSNVTLPSSSP